jgi:putative DNA primase/helicase
MWPAEGVMEVCLFNGKKPSHVGYFSDLERAARNIESFDGKGSVYVTLNPVKSDLLARYNNRLHKSTYQIPADRTLDKDITKDSWFLVDVDPKRASGISASEEERDAAGDVAGAVYIWLCEIGIPESAMMQGSSGNGFYILIRLPDYSPPKETVETKKAIVNFIADRFDTDKVEIDRKVYNPARLACALGTMKVKGENIPGRPHRRSEILAIGGEDFDPAKEQRCEPFDLYGLMGPMISKREEPSGKRERPSTDSYKGFDARLVAHLLSNPKETDRGYTNYDCPQCGREGKLWVREEDGKFGCWEPDSVCDWKELHRKLKDLARLPATAVSPLGLDAVVIPRTDSSHEGVLRDILSNLPTDVNFHLEAGVPSDKSVTKAQYYVVTVDKVLKVARELKCGLAKNLDFIYQYNGQYWKQIEAEVMMSFLGEAAEKMGVPRTKAKDYTFREALLKQFLSSAYLPAPSTRDDVTLINLLNGTFEIGTDKMELREFRREDFLTYQLPFAYDEGARAPKWEGFLDKVLPDSQLQDICVEYMGYCFTHDLKLEKVLLLYGSGANGKSVFFDVMSSLFGEENISHYGLAHLSHEYNRARVADKLLNYSSELGGKYATDLFKQMASGEPIQARLPYGRPFEMKMYAKLAFNANELPVVTEHTKAFFRRFLIVPFDVTIPEEEQDVDLAAKIIAEELPGVFNHVLVGLKRILECRKFSDSEKAKQAVEDYKRESDSVRMFLDDEGWVVVPDEGTKLTDLYAHYRGYCRDNGHFPLGRNKFAKRLEALGHTSRRNGGNQVCFLLHRHDQYTVQG